MGARPHGLCPLDRLYVDDLALCLCRRFFEQVEQAGRHRLDLQLPLLPLLHRNGGGADDFGESSLAEPQLLAELTNAAGVELWWLCDIDLPDVAHDNPHARMAGRITGVERVGDVLKGRYEPIERGLFCRVFLRLYRGGR